MKHPHDAGPLRWLAVLLAAALALAGCGADPAPGLLAEARSHIANAEYDAATLQLKTLLQTQPQSAEGRYLLGKALLESGHLAAAEAELRRAWALGQPDVVVVPGLSAALLGLDRGHALLREFGQTRLAEAHADAELQTHLAAAEAGAGQREAAQARLAQALSREPEFAPALLLQARLLSAGGDPAAAMAQVQALLERQPTLADAWHLRGELQLRAAAGEAGGGPDAALASFQRAIELAPAKVDAHAEAITLHLLRGDTTRAASQWAALQKVAPRHYRTLFLEATLAGHQRNFARVRELSQLLLRSNPNDLRVLLMAGQAELRLNVLTQAEAHFAKAAKLAPRAPEPRRWLAGVQLRLGQPDKALALLRPLAEGQPPDLQAIKQVAEIHLLRGDNRAAEASYARAAALQPGDHQARIGRAMARLTQGGQADPAAVAELQALSRADKGSSADLALVSGLLARGDLAAAQRALDALATKLPGQALPQLLRGRIALQRKDNPAARQAFEQALAADADAMPALAGLAMLDLAASQPAAAAARFTALLARHPQHVAAMMGLAEVTARGTGDLDEAVQWLGKAIQTDPTNPAPRLVLVDQLMGAQRLQQARAAAQAAVVALPGHADLLERLGQLQLMTGDTEQAVSSFNKLAGMRPKSALPHLRLADAHASAGNLQGMANAVRRAAELEPAAMAVLQAQAMLDLRRGKPEQALAVARKLQARAPDHALGYGIEGEAELRRQQYDAAALAFRKALARQQPGDSLLRLHAALVLGGHAAQADQLVAEQRQHQPDDLRLDMHLGDLALAGGDLPAAEHHYRAVLVRKPKSVVTLNNLAQVLALRQQPGAVAMAEQALALAPNTPALMDTLAQCLAAEHKLPRAIEVQARAVAAAPEVPQFRLQLARFYLQAGNKQGARGELGRLAALGPGFARQPEVADLMRSTDP